MFKGLKNWIEKLMASNRVVIREVSLNLPFGIGSKNVFYLCIFCVGHVIYFPYSNSSKPSSSERIVLEKGLEQFYESQQETFDKISEQITSAFENKIKLSSQLIKEAIFILENIIAMQDELIEHNQTISEVEHKINILLKAKS